MKKLNLTVKIDELAVSACRLMADEERSEFFAYQKMRDDSGESAPRKHVRRTTYYKGVNKGKEKQVFEVNGREFNLLWQLLKPYVLKSVARSYYKFHINEDYEEIYEIRALTFQALRFFGPRPCNSSFAAYFKLLVNNVLTNSANNRKKRIQMVSFSDVISNDEETSFAEIYPGSNYEDNYFWSTIADIHKPVVYQLLAGEKLSQIVKASAISQLRNELAQYCS